jgi:hypothetical protein
VSRASELVGKTMVHKDLGTVKVLGAVDNSRTQVEIEVLQRAKGWDEESETYKRVKSVRGNTKHSGKTIQWKTYNDSHSQYGHEDVCHINDLK